MKVSENQEIYLLNNETLQRAFRSTNYKDFTTEYRCSVSDLETYVYATGDVATFDNTDFYYCNIDSPGSSPGNAASFNF